MKFKELKERLEESETQTEQNMLFEEYWNSNAWVRFWIYSFILIVALLVLWVWVGLFIRLVRFIAF